MKIERVSDIAIVSPEGDLGHYHEALLSQVLGSLLHADNRKVVLNFSEVDHIHYALMSSLIEAVRLFRVLNGDLRFAGASPYLKKIFQAFTCNWDRALFDSLAEALLSFEEQTVSEQALH